MLNSELQQLLQEQMRKLPQEVVGAVTSPDFQNTVAQIGKETGLHIDQIGTLEDEVLLVMMGLTDPAEFSKQLAERGVPQEKVEAVVERVDARLLMPIRDAMRRFVEEEDARAEGEGAPSSALPNQPASQTQPQKVEWKSPVPAPMQEPVQKPAVQRPAQEELAPAEPAPPSVADPFAGASITKEEKVDVGMSARPPGYKVDPYREPVE